MTPPNLCLVSDSYACEMKPLISSQFSPVNQFLPLSKKLQAIAVLHHKFFKHMEHILAG